MENKSSETLEKGFMSGVNKTLIERPESVSLCNVGDNRIASCKEFTEGEVDIEKSMVSDVITENHHQIKIDHENKLFVVCNDNKFVSDCASVFEGNALHPHVPDSPTKIEVYGNDINLSVDVFGPLDGISNCNNENNKTLSFVVKNEHGDKEIAENQECTLDVGDLVWVKTRTKVWWPGMISDPTDAEKHANISGKKGNFLVKHFGNRRFVWCSNSEVRPFIEHFEQYSATNDSNNFSGSVQKALCEISRRVKSKMSCSCFEKGNQKHSRENIQENLILTKKVCKFELRSVPQFDPASFVANVKRLASTCSVPGKVDLIIMKDHLSAFYHSVGRCHLPLQLILPGTDVSDNSQDNTVTESKLKKRNNAVKTGLVVNDKVNSSSKGSESRSRKMSKYLSYPYVNENKEIESNLGDDTKKTSHVGKNSGKKGVRKNLMVRNTVSKEDNINASSGELLNELRAYAVDCSHRISKYSDSFKRFYCCFRIFSFLDTKISSKLVGTQIEGVASMKECDQGVDVESVKQGLSISERDTALHMKGNKTDGKKKKQEACFESKGNSLAMDSDVSPIIKPCSSDVSKHKIISSNKKKGRATREFQQDDMITTQPDLSGEPSSVNQHGKPLLGNLNGSVVSQNINGVTVPSLLDVQVTLENISQLNTGVGLNGTSNIQSGDFILVEPNAYAINIGLASSRVQNKLQMGGLLHPSSDKAGPKKRKTKAMTSQVDSIIPDLNGNVLLEDGPQLKRTSEEPGSSVKRRRILNNKEDSGGGLLLKFTPDFPLPSKETLIVTFSRFGLLNESEIQVLDSSTLQIMYERSSDAKFAFRSLEKRNPFGASLASFNLHRMPAVDPKTTIVKKRKVVTASPQQQPSNKKVGVIKDSPFNGEGDLRVMKQNVEMMKSALEKAGDTVSPEMRATLENEIKSFLDKISSSSLS